MKGSRMLPKLDLNVTNRCNYRCVHCAFDSGAYQMPELSLEKIREILTDTKDLCGEKIDITGGEPTVRKDLEDIVMIAASLGFKTEIVTNGSLLDKDRIERLRDAGATTFAVSLDGPDYESYSRIRLVSRETYSRVLATIDGILEAGVPLKINTVAFQSNYHRIPEITDFCLAKGVYEHGIYYFTAIGRGDSAHEMSVEPMQWLDFMRLNYAGAEEIAKYQGRLKVSVEFPYVERETLTHKQTGCLSDNERYHLQILPDGNVYPCAIMASYALPIANLHQCSVKDIWQNQAVWQDYWNRAQQIFARNNGSCVDFAGSFEMPSDKYRFVCPLRKFSPADLRQDGSAPGQ